VRFGDGENRNGNSSQFGFGSRPGNNDGNGGMGTRSKGTVVVLLYFQFYNTIN